MRLYIVVGLSEKGSVVTWFDVRNFLMGCSGCGSVVSWRVVLKWLVGLARIESVTSEIHLAMKSICAFHNATLFFAPQRSQDGPVVQWLRDMRKGEQSTRRWRG